MQAGDMFSDLGTGLDLDELFPVDQFFDSYVKKLEVASPEQLMASKEVKPMSQAVQPHVPVSMSHGHQQRELLGMESAYFHPQSARHGYEGLPKPEAAMELQTSFPATQQTFASGLECNDFGMSLSGVQPVGTSFPFGAGMPDMDMEPIPLGTSPMAGFTPDTSNRMVDVTAKSSDAKSGSGKTSVSRNRNRTVRQQALNKQAQQRYRQRKKARAVQLEHTVQALSSEIDQLKAVREEKQALEERALELEKALLEKEAEVQQLKCQSVQKKSQQKSSDGSDASSTEVDSNTKTGPSQLANDFHKKVQDLKDLLHQQGIAPSQLASPHSQDMSGPVAKEVAKQLAEVCGLCMRLVRIDGPNVWDLIQAETSRTISLDAIGEEQWFRIAASLQLTEEQVRTASLIRDECVKRLERIYINRQNLNLEAIGLLLPAEHGGKAPRLGKLGCFILGSLITRTKHSKKTHAVLEQLKENLREEQKLLADVDYMTYHRVVNPLQGAWAVLGLYPNHCDCLCLLNAIHERCQLQAKSQGPSGSQTT